MIVKLIGCCAAIALLYGCGGGGSSTTTPVTNELSGTASKGLLANADVQAYEVISGKLVKFGAAVKTKEDGTYVLTGLPSTSNPVVVEVTTNAQTTMLDETLPLVGGKYQKSGTNPAAGTAIRTSIGKLDSNTEVQVNPFTEMAVAAAQSAGFSDKSLAAAKVMVIETVGMNPFNIKAASAPTDLSPDQTKLMLLLTGVMQQATNSKATCPTDPTGVACAIKALNAKVEMQADSSGKFAMKDAAALATAVTAVNTAAATTSTVKSNFALSTAASTFQASAPTAVDATAALSRDGLQNFLDGIRTGFQTAQTIIKERSDLAEKRLEKLVIDGSKQALNDLGNALEACSANSTGTLVCAGSGFTLGADGYTTTRNSGGYTATATVSGTGVNGVLNMTLTGSAKRNSDSKPVASFSLSLAGSGLTSGSPEASFTVRTGTMRGYDSASNFDKWGQLDVSGMTLRKAKPGSLETLTLSGPLKLSSSDGDNFTGTINSLVMQELVTNVFYTGDTDLYAKSLDLSLGVNAKEGSILSTRLKYNRDLTAYNPDRPSTADNQKKEAVDLALAFADNVSATLLGSKTVYDKTDYTARVTSNGSTIGLTVSTQRASTTRDEHESMVGKLVLTGTGDYKAELTKGTGGGLNGDVFKGTTKIGTVTNGILTVDGRIMSIN